MASQPLKDTVLEEVLLISAIVIDMQPTSVFQINGPRGKLEAMLHQPSAGRQAPVCCIVCHPHPLFGGNMNNKVVTTLVKVFNQLNMLALRFNFRGVGGSEGEFARGSGEQQDLLAAIDWVREHYSEHKIYLAGFSFGAYVATKVAEQTDIDLLITIAPPVNHFDFTGVNISCPWYLVQGDLDEVVPATEVYDWIETLMAKPILIRLAEAGHFFHGQLGDLREKLVSALPG